MQTTTSICHNINCATVDISASGTLTVKDNNGDFIHLMGISPEQWAKALDLEQFKARLPEFV